MKQTRCARDVAGDGGVDLRPDNPESEVNLIFNPRKMTKI